MTRILMINGSYREQGITDQAVAMLAQIARMQGAEVDIVHLRNHPINFCLNCRQCTQAPGTNPGHCVQKDAMQVLIDKIEQADAYVLASPTNFASVTALFRRFMERLVVYGYWPWGQNGPVYRKDKLMKKPALLVSSYAAPAWIGRLFYQSLKDLKLTARTIGAKPVGYLCTGLIGQSPDAKLPGQTSLKAQRLVSVLLAQ